jgi:adenylate cyclase
MQLNEYLTAMVECVFRFGGTLDKFIGDAVMAVWGNINTDGPRSDAAAAVRAALAMEEELVRLNAKWHDRGLPKLRMGIAINHGDVVVGNIGSPHRMEFTVIGDAVNVSWKLQELTKEIGVELILSQSVASLITEHFEVTSLGAVDVVGLPQRCEIFTIARAIDVATEQVADPVGVA